MSSAINNPMYIIGELSNGVSTSNGRPIHRNESPPLSPRSALHPHHNNHQPFRNTRVESTGSDDHDGNLDDLDDPHLKTLARRFSYTKNSFIYKTASLSRRDGTVAPSTREGEASIAQQHTIDVGVGEAETKPKAAPPPVPVKHRSFNEKLDPRSPTSKAPMPLPRPTNEDLPQTSDSDLTRRGSKPPAPPPKPKLIGKDGRVKPPLPVKPVRQAGRSDSNASTKSKTTAAEEAYLIPLKPESFRQDDDSERRVVVTDDRGSKSSVKLRPKRRTQSARHSQARAASTVSFADDQALKSSRDEETEIFSVPDSSAVAEDGSRSTRTISREIPLPILPVRGESFKKKRPNAIVRFFNAFKSIFVTPSKRKSKTRKALQRTATESTD